MLAKVLGVTVFLLLSQSGFAATADVGISFTKALQHEARTAENKNVTLHVSQNKHWRFLK